MGKPINVTPNVHEDQYLHFAFNSQSSHHYCFSGVSKDYAMSTAWEMAQGKMAFLTCRKPLDAPAPASSSRCRRPARGPARAGVTRRVRPPAWAVPPAAPRGTAAAQKSTAPTVCP